MNYSYSCIRLKIIHIQTTDGELNEYIYIYIYINVRIYITRYAHNAALSCLDEKRKTKKLTKKRNMALRTHTSGDLNQT